VAAGAGMPPLRGMGATIEPLDFSGPPIEPFGVGPVKDPAEPTLPMDDERTTLPGPGTAGVEEEAFTWALAAAIVGKAAPEEKERPGATWVGGTSVLVDGLTGSS